MHRGGRGWEVKQPAFSSLPKVFFIYLTEFSLFHVEIVSSLLLLGSIAWHYFLCPISYYLITHHELHKLSRKQSTIKLSVFISFFSLIF